MSSGSRGIQRSSRKTHVVPLGHCCVKLSGGGGGGGLVVVVVVCGGPRRVVPGIPFTRLHATKSRHTQSPLPFLLPLFWAASLRALRVPCRLVALQLSLRLGPAVFGVAAASKTFMHVTGQGNCKKPDLWQAVSVLSSLSPLLWRGCKRVCVPPCMCAVGASGCHANGVQCSPRRSRACVRVCAHHLCSAVPEVVMSPRPPRAVSEGLLPPPPGGGKILQLPLLSTAPWWVEGLDEFVF